MTGPADTPPMPAGWYPDPELAETQRYWDGEAWSDHRAPAAQAAAAGQSGAGKRRPVLYALGILAAAAAGVGITLLATGDSDDSGSDPVVTVTTTAPETGTGDEPVVETSIPPESEDAAVDPKNNCDALGINTEELKEGTCFEKGQELVTVNKGSTLKLDQLTAGLVEISTASSLTGYSGRAKTPSGIFVVARLEITNTTGVPQTYNAFGDLGGLTLGGDYYTEDFNIENGTATDSFSWRSKELQPNESMTGTMVFDVPESAVADLERDGNLAIGNFRDDFATGRFKQVGIFRTYN